jgi:hypothetical protein
MIQFLNPINEKAMSFMSIDSMDYPCSNMKEFETIVTVTKSFLQALVRRRLQTPWRRPCGALLMPCLPPNLRAALPLRS